VRISDYPSDAIEGGDLAGRALGVASGNENLRVWLFSVQFPDRVPRVGVCAGGNRACIQNNEIGFGSSSYRMQASLFKGGFDTCAVGLRGAASEALHKHRLVFRIMHYTFSLAMPREERFAADHKPWALLLF
jgi:hypothetical protein